MTRDLRFDGWSWPHPTRVAELEWTLRYGAPTREELLEAAGMLNALHNLTSPHFTTNGRATRKLAKVRRAARDEQLTRPAGGDEGRE